MEIYDRALQAIVTVAAVVSTLYAVWIGPLLKRIDRLERDGSEKRADLHKKIDQLRSDTTAEIHRVEVASIRRDG